MNSTVEHLVQLGLKEYEAKIYIALVSLGEANVRKIHEVSGVPRPRVYDILYDLAEKGFINIRQGSPLMYRAVSPESVVAFLKKNLDNAAQESVKALETLSVIKEQKYSPIWYVHSDWTIQNSVELLGNHVRQNLVILCLNTDALQQFKGPIASVAKNRTVKILVPKKSSETIPFIDGAILYKAGNLKNFFGVNIFEKVFTSPLTREGAVYNLEIVLIADDQESMLIYSRNGKRMAVIIDLPFITSVQNQLFNQMIARGREIPQRK